MDLALEFGMPAELLASVLTEREFQRWLHYAKRKPLPARRIEYYLAQISQWIAMTMGGAANAKLPDFLITFKSAEEGDDEEDIDVEEVREAFEYKPRKRLEAK